MTLRATALDQTSIRTGGRRREPAKSRLARRAHHRMLQAGHSRRPPGGKAAKGDKSERHRKTSLFRRLSNKRASAEIQQQVRVLSCPIALYSFIYSFSVFLRFLLSLFVSVFAVLPLQSFRLQSPLSAPVLPRGCPSPFLVILT